MNRSDERRTILLLYLVPTLLLLSLGCFGCGVNLLGWMVTRSKLREREKDKQRQKPRTGR